MMLLKFMDSFARFMNRIISKMKQIISNNKGDDLMKRVETKIKIYKIHLTDTKYFLIV